jgi:hypothetical protein
MEKTELVVRREYSKGDQRLALIVRLVSGGNIDGVVFRFETWVNNKEDEGLRIESGDVYYVQAKFFAKLIDLFEDHWKRENVGDGEGRQHAKLFDPETL